MVSFTPVVPEDAATVVLVREEADGLEVYMTRRHDRLKFLPGFHVFPGGKVDAADSSADMVGRCRDLTPTAAVSRLPETLDPRRAFGFFAAAVRELFEEAGVLLAEDAAGSFLDSPGPELAKRLADHRRELQARRRDFLSVLHEENLFGSLGKLLWFAHWITPATSPRRFNTYFLLAQKPAGQDPSPFTAEIASALWVRPNEALEKWRTGQWFMIPPTIASLDSLAPYRTWADLERDYQRTPAEHHRTIWKG